MAARPPSSAGPRAVTLEESMREGHATLLLEAPAPVLQWYSKPDTMAQRYEENYSMLRDWVAGSLDVVRPELQRLLWPVFVHLLLELISQSRQSAQSFIHRFAADHEVAHADELRALVNDHLLIKTSELARRYRSSKFVVFLSLLAARLLSMFLHEAKLFLATNIINRFVQLEVRATVPQSVAEKELAYVVGVEESLRGLVDESVPLPDVRWGRLGPEAGVEGEAAGRAFEWSADRAARDGSVVDPQPNMPAPSAEMLRRMREDIRARAPLSAEVLPSINFFTFTHGSGLVNRSEIAPKSSLVAAGCSDSSVVLWDLAAPSAGRPGHGLETSSLGGGPAHAGGGGDPSVTVAREVQMHGHGGPVYGLSFSPDSQW